MKKKIIIVSIFAAILMLAMPLISNMQAQPVPTAVKEETTNECTICPKTSNDGLWCRWCNWIIDQANFHLQKSGVGDDIPNTWLEDLHFWIFDFYVSLGYIFHCDELPN